MVLYLFGCDVFGQHIGIDSIALIFRVLVLAVSLFGLALSIKSMSQNIFNQFLLLCIGAVSLISALAEWNPSPSFQSRIMHCFYFPLMLLFAQIDWKRMVSLIKIREKEKIANGVGVASILLMMLINVSIIRVEENPVKKEYERFRMVADALVARGRTRGYGTYWFSSSVTLASEFQVDVRPVMGQDLSIYRWLSKDPNDWEYADFVLVDESMWGFVTKESIIDCIGDPAEQVRVNNIDILFWNKNIIPYINGAGNDEKTIDAWWNMEDGQTEKEIATTNNHFASDFKAGDDGYYTSEGYGMLLWGPYRSLEEGVYDISFEYECSGDQPEGTILGIADVFSNAGGVEFKSAEAIAGENCVTIKNVRVFSDCTDVETRFCANVAGVTIRKIVIKYLGENPI